MACGTFRDLFAVRKKVTVPAFGHQFLPVVFGRTIGMKTFVAFLAFKLVTATVVLKIIIKSAVALTALDRCKGRRFNRVEAGGR